MPPAVRLRYAWEPRKPRCPSLAPWVLAWTLCPACGSSPRPSRHADELYDLRSDPLEQRDGVATEPRLVAGLEAAPPPPRPPGRDQAGEASRASPDSVFLERLRAVGYLDDSRPQEEGESSVPGHIDLPGEPAATQGAGKK